MQCSLTRWCNHRRYKHHCMQDIHNLCTHNHLLQTCHSCGYRRVLVTLHLLPTEDNNHLLTTFSSLRWTWICEKSSTQSWAGFVIIFSKKSVTLAKIGFKCHHCLVQSQQCFYLSLSFELLHFFSWDDVNPLANPVLTSTSAPYA